MIFSISSAYENDIALRQKQGSWKTQLLQKDGDHDERFGI